MAKRYLHEFIAKNDEQYDVVIYSYENILTPDNLNKVKSALKPYILRDITKGSTLMAQEYPEQFPSIPFCNMHRIEAKVGLMPKKGYERIRQELSMTLKIEAKRLHVSKDGKAIGNEDDIIHAANPKITKIEDDEASPSIADKVSGPSLLKYIKELSKQERNGWSAYTIKDHEFITTHSVLAEADIARRAGLYRCRLTENGIFVIGQVQQSQDDLPFYTDIEEINFSSLDPEDASCLGQCDQEMSQIDTIVSVISDMGLTVANIGEDEDDFQPDVEIMEDGVCRVVVQENSIDMETLQSLATNLGTSALQVHLIIDRDWNQLGLVFTVD